ncbi:MAG: GGDEF domain-containing protein [Phycisphaerales bacterium]|nr:GGDEF domain-containing protein [Hyphomonadaceae bacterium]
MAWFPLELQNLRSVVAATLDHEGLVLAANAGFLNLVNVDAEHQACASVAHFFINPNFNTLGCAQWGGDGEVYCGLMTIGDPEGRTRSLRGRVWRTGGELRVLAEFDVEELERLSATVLELNAEYADAQLQLAQANLRLKQREAEIVALTLMDPLTGVGNRRKLEQSLDVETHRAKRSGGKLCALMADLDHFKRVNDTWGHECGDKVLSRFGALLREHTRPTDIVARSGGEEFIVLMPQTALDQALEIAERIRALLASVLIDPIPIPITVSVGVAELVADELGEALLRRADKALYEAKQAGRNRVVPSLRSGDPARSSVPRISVSSVGASLA